MASISKLLREKVTTRAKGLCEYCQVAQTIVIDMEIDHIVPESLGGETSEANLCLACAGCNNFKSDAQTAIDPETGQRVPLYNPRAQDWNAHFQWSDNGTQLIGLTPIGRATISKLRINRDLAVRARERWVKAGWHPPRD